MTEELLERLKSPDLALLTELVRQDQRSPEFAILDSAVEPLGKNGFGGNGFHGLADWVLLAQAVEQRDLARAEGWAQFLLDPNPTYQPIAEPMAGLLQQGLSARQAGNELAAPAFFSRSVATATAAAELYAGGWARAGWNPIPGLPVRSFCFQRNAFETPSQYD